MSFNATASSSSRSSADALRRRRKRHGTLEQVDRRRPVSPRERAAPGARQPRRRLLRQRPIAAPELAPVARRLLEVVADELVLLLALVEPAREPLVQVAPELLRQRVVGGVADQQMAEAELVVAGRADELLADERAERVVDPHRTSSSDRRSTALRRKRWPSTAARSSTCRSSRGSRSSRAASSTWIDGGTGSSRTSPDAVQQPSSIRIRSSSSRSATISSTKSGLPPAACSIRARDRPRCTSPLPRRFRASRPVSAGGERLEEDRGRVVLAAAPGVAGVEELRSGHADDEERRVAHPVGDVLDQVEERRLGPVDVVEDDDERLLAAPAPRTACARPRTPPRACRRSRPGRRSRSRARRRPRRPRLRPPPRSRRARPPRRTPGRRSRRPGGR